MRYLRALPIAFVAMGHPAYAQQVPGAGSQLQQIPPAPVTPPKDAPLIVPVAPPAIAAEPGGPRIRVDVLHVSGATLFPESTLIAASGIIVGSELDLAGLRTAAARISAYYNQRGYFLARAYLPAQDVKGGTITIDVIEGRYGKVGITNTSNLRDGVALDVLSGLDPNDVVDSAPLERRLLLLSDIPGIAVSSTLSPAARKDRRT